MSVLKELWSDAATSNKTVSEGVIVLKGKVAGDLGQQWRVHGGAARTAGHGPHLSLHRVHTSAEDWLESSTTCWQGLTGAWPPSLPPQPMQATELLLAVLPQLTILMPAKAAVIHGTVAALAWQA